ncbi:SMP-30/gluconolactonase/LRE family protein, partial [Verrucomicrobiota bacterium]
PRRIAQYSSESLADHSFGHIVPGRMWGCIMRNSAVLVIAVASFFGITPIGSGSGFTDGELLVTDYSSVYSVDPETGLPKVLVTDQVGLIDIVWNQQSGSAFVAAGVGGTSILELTWTPGKGFAIRPFLGGLDRAFGLAADSAGQVYFSQGGATGRIWRVDLDTNVTAVTAYDSRFLRSPNYMALSPDESELYVTVHSTCQIDVVSFPVGTLRHLTDELGTPYGIDVDDGGVVYAADEASASDRVVAITPDGVATTYAQESWMDVGGFGDLEFDDDTRTLYVNNAFRLYAIDTNGVSSRLFNSPRSLALKGLDLITKPVPVRPVIVGIDAAADKVTVTASNLTAGIVTGFERCGDIPSMTWTTVSQFTPRSNVTVCTDPVTNGLATNFYRFVVSD